MNDKPVEMSEHKKSHLPDFDMPTEKVIQRKVQERLVEKEVEEQVKEMQKHLAKQRRSRKWENFKEGVSDVKESAKEGPRKLGRTFSNLKENARLARKQAKIEEIAAERVVHEYIAEHRAELELALAVEEEDLTTTTSDVA